MHAEVACERRVRVQTRQPLGQRLRVARRDQVARVCVDDDAVEAAHAGGDHRRGARHGSHHCVGAGRLRRRANKHIRRAVPVAQVGRRDSARHAQRQCAHIMPVRQLRHAFQHRVAAAASLRFPSNFPLSIRHSTPIRFPGRFAVRPPVHLPVRLPPCWPSCIPSCTRWCLPPRLRARLTAALLPRAQHNEGIPGQAQRAARPQAHGPQHGGIEARRHNIDPAVHRAAGDHVAPLLPAVGHHAVGIGHQLRGDAMARVGPGRRAAAQHVGKTGGAAYLARHAAGQVAMRMQQVIAGTLLAQKVHHEPCIQLHRRGRPDQAHMGQALPLRALPGVVPRGENIDLAAQGRQFAREPQCIVQVAFRIAIDSGSRSGGSGSGNGRGGAWICGGDESNFQHGETLQSHMGVR